MRLLPRSSEVSHRSCEPDELHGWRLSTQTNVVMGRQVAQDLVYSISSARLPGASSPRSTVVAMSVSLRRRSRSLAHGSVAAFQVAPRVEASSCSRRSHEQGHRLSTTFRHDIETRKKYPGGRVRPLGHLRKNRRCGCRPSITGISYRAASSSPRAYESSRRVPLKSARSAAASEVRSTSAGTVSSSSADNSRLGTTRILAGSNPRGARMAMRWTPRPTSARRAWSHALRRKNCRLQYDSRSSDYHSSHRVAQAYLNLSSSVRQRLIFALSTEPGAEATGDRISRNHVSTKAASPGRRLDPRPVVGDLAPRDGVVHRV